MGPTRKSRIKKKQFLKFDEVSPDTDGLCARNCKMGKNRSTDKSGSQWSNEELKCFYEAFCKYGRNWKKVASAVQSRSVDMVKALYSMNRAYLSLPEGTASVAGLIAMVRDHYNMLVRQELKEFSSGKTAYDDEDDHMASAVGGVITRSRPRTVGKRTSRFPVSFVYDKEERTQCISFNKDDLAITADSADEEVAHVAALALAEASQRGVSPRASQAPNRRTDNMGANKFAESEMPSLKVVGSRTNESWYKVSPEDKATEGEALVEDATYMADAEGTATAEIQPKQNDFQEKKSKVSGVQSSLLSGIREACSSSEGLVPMVVEDEHEHEVTYDKGLKSSPLGSRKRSRKMFSRGMPADENSDLHALQTLAELSVNILIPDTAIDSELTVQDKKEKKKTEKPCAREAVPSKRQKERSKISRKKGRKSTDVVIVSLEKQENGSSLHIDALSERKQEAYQTTTNMLKRKRKSLAAIGSSEVGKRSTDNAKCVSNTIPLSKSEKSLQSPELLHIDPGRLEKYSVDSIGQVSQPNEANSPNKPRSRHKENLKKAMVPKEMKSTNSAQNFGNNGLDGLSPNIRNRALNLKNKLSHCLSSQALRRWCAFEWFYSAIDYPWFARSEFVEYLNHVGLGHVPRLTRVEWGVIRSSLGKPRRLSKQFLQEERKKLEQYRESVRTHYCEVRAGVRENLATDLVHPLSVGQLVIACHPRTREIHDGNVLIVDHEKYMIQFDKPGIGVEFVKTDNLLTDKLISEFKVASVDIDCMPLNPLESLSEALGKLHGASKKSCKKFVEPKLESMGDTVDTVLRAKAAADDVFTAQVTCKPPVSLEEIQEREVDIRSISRLAWALDKKVATCPISSPSQGDARKCPKTEST
ncbi:hypothetical protein ACLOJK_024785 [Asimina triloba]